MFVLVVLAGAFGLDFSVDSGASAQSKKAPAATVLADQFLSVPARQVKTLRLPGTKLAKARWKGSFSASGSGGGRVDFMVSDEKQTLFEAASASSEFDVPIARDGLILTVRNDSASDRRVVVKSRLESGK